MNQQLIELRIKAEKKSSYTNGLFTGLIIGIFIALVIVFTVQL